MLCCSHSCGVVNSTVARDIVERAYHKLMLLGYIYIYCNGFTLDEAKLVAESGGKASIATEFEMQMGMGILLIRFCIEHGMKLSLSIDALAAVALDLLSQMRLALQMQRCMDYHAVQQRSEVLHEVEYIACDALIWGTRGGAEAVGLGDKIGTLTLGKRADVVFLSNKRHLSPSVFPLATAVLHSTTSDVDTVLIDDMVRKRYGCLVGQDVGNSQGCKKY